MRRLLGGSLAVVVAATVVVVTPTLGTTVPHTRAETARLTGAVVDPDLSVDFVGVQWDGEEGSGAIRFRHGSRWGGWQTLPADGVEVPGTFASALVAGQGADAYQVIVPKGRRNARAVAINSTDRQPGLGSSTASAAVPVVSRSDWQADESLMTWAPQYYGPAQKITVHHTATANADPDPAATVRAIYRYHAVDRGFGDIGYHFLIDEAGRVYEGRFSGSDGDPAHDAPGSSALVTAAHVGGYNSANAGIALLGTLTSQPPTDAAQRAAEQLIADLAGRHGIDPTGSSTYVNPVNGVRWTGENVPGHRDWEATECPGAALHALLPTIRANAKALMSPAADTRSPVISSVTASPSSTSAVIRWTTDEAATSEVQWRRAGTTTWAVLTTPALVTSHRVDLTGLARRTRYEYRVRSVDAAGNASLSSVSTFRTKS